MIFSTYWLPEGYKMVLTYAIEGLQAQNCDDAWNQWRNLKSQLSHAEKFCKQQINATKVWLWSQISSIKIKEKKKWRQEPFAFCWGLGRN
jgi:hypothetical protein